MFADEPRSLIGILFGLQKMRLALITQLVLNALNAGLDVVFVLGFDWGVFLILTPIYFVTMTESIGDLTATTLLLFIGTWIFQRRDFR